MPIHYWRTLEGFVGAGGGTMNEAEAAARPRVGAAVEELERIVAQLQEIAEGLPVPDDGEVSLRSVIECVLADSLQPAILDLREEAQPRGFRPTIPKS